MRLSYAACVRYDRDGSWRHRTMGRTVLAKPEAPRSKDFLLSQGSVRSRLNSGRVANRPEACFGGSSSPTSSGPRGRAAEAMSPVARWPVASDAIPARVGRPGWVRSSPSEIGHDLTERLARDGAPVDAPAAHVRMTPSLAVAMAARGSAGGCRCPQSRALTRSRSLGWNQRDALKRRACSRVGGARRQSPG